MSELPARTKDDGSRATPGRPRAPWTLEEMEKRHPDAYRAACKYAHDHPPISALSKPYGVQSFIAGVCFGQGYEDAISGNPFDHEPRDCADYRAGFEDGTEPIVASVVARDDQDDGRGEGR